jgi:hypothetical protein
LLLALTSVSSCRGGDAKDATMSRGNWEFSSSAGPAYRQSVTLGFAAGSRSSAFPLTSFVGEIVLVTPHRLDRCDQRPGLRLTHRR